MTGRFYRNPAYSGIVKRLNEAGHYLGAHSDQHILYCDWTNRDSLLVTKKQFTDDLRKNYEAMAKHGVEKQNAPFFLPPYEWYNDTIAAWTNELGLQLINYTPGTRSNADYTTPTMKNYTSSAAILQSIIEFEKNARNGLNGFILLLHIGTDVARTDKFYLKLPTLINLLHKKGYRFTRIDELLCD